MYVLYYQDTTALVNRDKSHKTERAAKSYRTRLLNKGATRTIQIAELNDYKTNIEAQVERINLMSGKPYMESINTPPCCSPACETYWCM